MIYHKPMIMWNWNIDLICDVRLLERLDLSSSFVQAVSGIDFIGFSSSNFVENRSRRNTTDNVVFSTKAALSLQLYRL